MSSGGDDGELSGSGWLAGYSEAFFFLLARSDPHCFRHDFDKLKQALLMTGHISSGDVSPELSALPLMFWVVECVLSDGLWE